ncbi:MAG: nucleotide exchange factor GrpE [Nocardioidaceae bacterium]
MTFDPEKGAPSEGPVIRDKRRIDPETGEVRERQETAAPGSPAAGTVEPDALAEAERALAERTADLQRLQAEYVNYKRRVDRDRESVREAAVAHALSALLPVLDDIGRAREHNELTGGFKAVAESFERIVAGLGLERFGAAGDPFDPRIHEALMHNYSEDVDGPVCQTILQVGYRFGDRIVRPARVAVVEPQEAPEGAMPDGGTAPGGDAAEAEPADGTEGQR